MERIFACMQEYFRKLKFIHLELDMKRIFLEDTLGSCEHTKEEVARLGELHLLSSPDSQHL